METNTLIRMESRKKKSHRKRKHLCEKKPERLERSRNGQMKPPGRQEASCRNKGVCTQALGAVLQRGYCWKPGWVQKLLPFCQAVRAVLKLLILSLLQLLL